jgi:hypothetical protein
MQAVIMGYMENGTRVKYVGRSVTIAAAGEKGTVIGLSREMSHDRGRMVEVAWDQGAGAYYWPAELEVVEK